MSTIKKMSVIIADNHTIFRQSLVILLNSFCFIDMVIEVAQEEEVMRQMLSGLYECILIDIGMGSFNRPDVIHALHKKNPKVKIILISLINDGPSIVAMMNAGAHGFLLKNADKHDLERALLSAMNDRNYFSSGISQSIVSKFHSIKNSFEKIKLRPGINSEKLREIIFLLCQEKTSEETGTILNYSKRTIEKYRGEIMELTGSRSLVGLVRYGIEKGICSDEYLLKKFSRYLSKHAE